MNTYINKTIIDWITFMFCKYNIIYDIAEKIMKNIDKDKKYEIYFNIFLNDLERENRPRIINNKIFVPYTMSLYSYRKNKAHEELIIKIIIKLCKLNSYIVIDNKKLLLLKYIISIPAITNNTKYNFLSLIKRYVIFEFNDIIKYCLKHDIKVNFVGILCENIKYNSHKITNNFCTDNPFSSSNAANSEFQHCVLRIEKTKDNLKEKLNYLLIIHGYIKQALKFIFNYEILYIEKLNILIYKKKDVSY